MNQSGSLKPASAEVPLDLAAGARPGGEIDRRPVSLTGIRIRSGHSQIGRLRSGRLWLRRSCRAFLSSRGFGKNLSLIYNDRYIPILGEKHPAALGAPGSEVW
jgi:hypothetical protein